MPIRKSLFLFLLFISNQRCLCLLANGGFSKNTYNSITKLEDQTVTRRKDLAFNIIKFSIYTSCSLFLKLGWYIMPTRKSALAFAFYFHSEMFYGWIDRKKYIFTLFYTPTSFVLMVAKFNSITWNSYILLFFNFV